MYIFFSLWGKSFKRTNKIPKSAISKGIFKRDSFPPTSSPKNAKGASTRSIKPWYGNASWFKLLLKKYCHGLIFSNDIEFKKGDAFAQGIITQYFKTVTDCTTTQRTGGMGSTSK